MFGSVVARMIADAGESMGELFSDDRGLGERLRRSSARSIDNAAGINASHIFIEYYTLRAAGFGQAHPLRLSDNSWATGLAFEF